MLDITTNRWSLRACEGGATLAQKKPYRVAFLPHDAIPPFAWMSQASERAFDERMQELFDKAGATFSR